MTSTSSWTVKKCCCILLAAILFVDVLTSAAPYQDYENIRDLQALYDLLLQNNAQLNERYGGSSARQLVRKSGRDPTVRLRFGRRADPDWLTNTNKMAPADSSASRNSQEKTAQAAAAN